MSNIATGALIVAYEIPLRIDLKVNVRQLAEEQPDKEAPPNARIQDFDDKSIVLAPTLDELATPIEMEVGDQIVLTLSYTAESRGQRFSAPSEVVGRVERALQPLWRVRRPKSDEFKRIQDRQHVRAPVRLNLVWRQAPSGGAPVGQWRAAEALDLSAGGLMISQVPLQVDDVIDIIIPLDSGEINVRGKVIRQLGTPSSLACGVKFVDIQPKAREQIVRYIFQRQLELRRKGIL